MFTTGEEICFKVPLGNEDNVWMTGLLSHTSKKELSYINFKSKVLMKLY